MRITAIEMLPQSTQELSDDLLDALFLSAFGAAVLVDGEWKVCEWFGINSYYYRGYEA